MNNDPILFYGGGYNCFSNMSSYAVEIDGILFMTSEHAYQYARFDSEVIKNQILNTRSAYDAKRIATENKEATSPGWHERNLAVMEGILRKKLEQHPHIKKKLLETGTREIIEDSKDDSFWGRGSDGSGRNEHGKIWMKLRSEITTG